MRPSRFPSFARVVLALLVAACGGDDGTSSESTAISIVPVTPTTLSGVAGQQLPEEILARVVDARGRPVVGQAVNFVVVTGDGWAINNSWVSNDSGLVRERWRLGGTAGVVQVLEARAIDRRTLETVATATFTATARPAALATLRVVGDTLRVVAHGDSTLVEIEGRDQFGNVVPRSTFEPLLVSSSADAVVTSTRWVRVQGWDDVVISAHAGAAESARVRLTIARDRLALHVVDGSWFTSVVRAHGAVRGLGIETSTTGQRGVAYRLEGATLVRERTFQGNLFDSWSAGPDAPAWAVFEGGLFTSTPTGEWTQAPAFPRGTARSVTALLDGTTYVSTATQDLRPYVYRRVGDTWQDLAFPQVRGDSAYQAVNVIAVPGAVLAIGGLEVRRFSGVSRPSIARWDGTQWTWLVLPPVPAGTLEGAIATPSFTSDGSVGFALRWVTSASGARVYELLEIRGTTVTASALAFSTGMPVSLVTTPDGRPIVVTWFGWHEREATGNWTTHRVPTPWQAAAATSPDSPWLDADGALWIPLAHPDRQPASSAIPTTSALLRYRR